ncbi:MAG: hypothetical protein EB088_15650, partial [Betaproteobacteria bacterium]|nr:hypothetical protein [Betaproteobacteria bacterium]
MIMGFSPLVKEGDRHVPLRGEIHRVDRAAVVFRVGEDDVEALELLVEVTAAGADFSAPRSGNDEATGSL